MTKLWIGFAELCVIVSEQIGSTTLAVGEISKNLRSGGLRALSDRSDVYDLTGEVIRTYEYELDAEWWNKRNRFRRSSLTGRLELSVPGKSAQILEGGSRIYDPFSYSNIRFWYPDVARIYEIKDNLPPQLLQKDKSGIADSSSFDLPLQRRPSGSSYEKVDRLLFAEIERLLSEGEAQGAYGAALLIADRIVGAGTPSSKAKRVASLYNRDRNRPP